MGLFDNFVNKDKLSEMTVKTPREVFNNVLRQTSGSSIVRDIKYNIFYQIIAFKGVVDGVGSSTLVANTALALADLGLTVCVVDTSILQPVQDILLKSNYTNGSVDKKDRLDWFDMPYTRLSPLHVSTINRDVSILSFYGKNRGITDILSTNDSENLVEIAFTELHNKFDIILVDCCHELSSINTAALQKSQSVIQVWNDSPSVVGCLDNFITNCVTLSCPLDKMRYVVYSKVNPDVMGNLDGLLEQYRLKKLAETVLSRDVSRVINQGKPLWQYPSKDADIISYTDAVIDIACHICNIENARQGGKGRGTISSNDIMEGKVDGTLSKKMRDSQTGVEVATTLDQADAQLRQPRNPQQGGQKRPPRNPQGGNN